jgi:hypothetical protein
MEVKNTSAPKNKNNSTNKNSEENNTKADDDKKQQHSTPEELHSRCVFIWEMISSQAIDTDTIFGKTTQEVDEAFSTFSSKHGRQGSEAFGKNISIVCSECYGCECLCGVWCAGG